MNALNHIVGGVAIASIAGAIENVNIYDRPELLAVTVAAALLPDIDQPGSLGFGWLPGVPVWIHRRFGHRTITHSVLIWAILSAAVGAIAPPLWGFFFSVGFASHIFLDILTVSGVPIFYPFSAAVWVFPADDRLRCSTKNHVAQAAWTAVFAAVIWSTFSLAQRGFWNSYNAGFSTPRHVASEMRKTDRAVRVSWRVRRGSEVFEGDGFAVEADETKLVLFDDSTGWHSFAAPDYVFERAEPSRTNTFFRLPNFVFAGISHDSLIRMIHGKNILKIDLAANCDFEAWADYRPPVVGKKFSDELLRGLNVRIFAPDIQTEKVSFRPPVRVASLRARAARIRKKYESERGDWLNDRAQAESLVELAADERDIFEKTRMIERARELEKTREPLPIRDELAAIAAEIKEAEAAAMQDFLARAEKAKADFEARLPEPPRFSGSVTFAVFLENDLLSMK